MLQHCVIVTRERHHTRYILGFLSDLRLDNKIAIAALKDDIAECAPSNSANYCYYNRYYIFHVLLLLGREVRRFENMSKESRHALLLLSSRSSEPKRSEVAPMHL